MDVLQKRKTEINRIKNDNSIRKQIENDVSDKESSYKKSLTSLQILEEKANTKKLKIEQSESSLYGGAVKNPKELQDLQAEIKSLKNSVMIIEEEQIQNMIDLECKETELSEIKAKLSDFDKELSIQFSALFAEEKTINSELEKILQEQKAIGEQISPENLTLYQSLRKMKNGIAVSGIEDGCCSVCGSTLTPADCQLAKSPLQMATCASCGRILYAG